MRSKRRSIFTPVLVACTITICVTGQALLAQPPAATGHDFGVVKAGTVVTHTFEVSRAASGGAVARVELSEPGMKVRVTGANTRDEQLALTVTWDTAPLAGLVEARVTVYWTDPSQAPARLTLRGTVKPVVAVTPLPAVFFSVYHDEAAERTVKILNRDDKPLELTRLEPIGNHFTAAFETLVPGQEYAVTVRVPAGTEFGRFQEGLVVHTNHPARAEIPVAVNVFVKPDLYASPEVVDFGQVNLDDLRRTPALRESSAQVVGIRHRRGPFTITSVQADVPGLNVKVAPSGPASTFRLDLALDPAQMAPGTINGAVRLRTSDPMFPEVVVPVRGDVR